MFSGENLKALSLARVGWFIMIGLIANLSIGCGSKERLVVSGADVPVFEIHRSLFNEA